MYIFRIADRRFKESITVDAVLNEISSFVQAQGGKATYEAIVQALPYEMRAKAYNALRVGKSQGVLKKYLGRMDENSPMTTIVELISQ